MRVKFPKLSVIIPSLNQGKYIERTILSILKQDYRGKLQIIVSDGGSEDETIDILKKYPQIIWWSEPDRGFADAVNKALKVAKGEIVAIQSSDDYYLPDTFNASVEFLMGNRKYGIVTANDIYLKNDMRTYSKSHIYNHEITPRNLLTYRNIPQHCTFVRRSAVEEVGGVRNLSDGKVDYLADTDLWYRILHFYKGIFLPRYSAVYQYHNNQRASRIELNKYHILKRMIESCEKSRKYSSNFIFDPIEKELILLLAKLRITSDISDSKLLKLKKALVNRNTKIDIKMKIENLLYKSKSKWRKIYYYYKDKTLFKRIKMEGKYFIRSVKQSDIDINWWKK